jgi:hypothetical protein
LTRLQNWLHLFMWGFWGLSVMSSGGKQLNN